MKLVLKKIFFGRVFTLTLFALSFFTFNAHAQTVVCPSDTDLGTYDCNSIDTAPPQINTMEAALAPPYGIEITDALPETGVTTQDSAVLFYCESDAREVVRLVIIYNDTNYNFSYDEGEEVATCTYVLQTESDTEAPTFTAPDDFETTCVLGIDTTVTGKPLIPSDSCPDLTTDNVNFSDAPPVIGGCPGEKIYVRSWTATDPCGNANDPQTQTITVKDLTGPEFTVPADISVPCGTDPADASITGDVTDGFDECEGVDITVQGRIVMTETQENTPCPGFTTYVKRWGGIDGCGNANTKDQLIIVECPADCSNADICVGDILTDPLPGECECQVVEAQVLGCTDPTAGNYDPAANCDDESCEGDFDLALDKEIITPGPYAPGQDVTYSITITNEGDVIAQNIEITDDVPSALTFNAAMSPGWSVVGSGITTTIAGPLAPGESASVNLTFTINADAGSGSTTNTAEITGAEDENGNPAEDIDSTPDNGVPGEDDIDSVTIDFSCPDDAGNMATALVTVCGGDNVNAPSDGAVVPAGSVQTYLLHDGTGTIIYDINSNGTFINDGTYPTNVQLYISSAVGPDDGTGFPNLSATCTDIADGTPVIFYDPIVISHEIDCDQTTATASVNFSIIGGGPSASGGSYTVTGSFNGDVNPGEQNIISGISDGSTYSLTVINDGKGCTAFIDPQTVSCTKTPIELISYEGEAQKEGNLLKWVTASEIENAYFTLERATTTSNFVEINEQAGAGTYSMPSRYSYVDREAPNGLSYYRLKQTDIDGTTVEVGVVEIQRSEPTFDIINIHPIPVLNNFELFIDSEENQIVEVNVYNSIGELMHAHAYELTNAVNKINVDVTAFGGGIYVVSAIVGEDIISHKIIKY